MEILTRSGWKAPETLNSSDYVCSIDPKTFKARFAPANAKISPYSGKALFIETDKISQVIPTNSNCVTVSSGLLPANSVMDNEHEFANSCFLEGGNNLKENYGKLLGFYIGDGTVVDGATGFIRFHIKKPRKVKYLKSLGYDIEDKSGNSYLLRKPNIGTFFREQMYTEDKLKKFPNDYLSFSANTLENILDGLRNSDGENVKKDNTFQLTTESKTIAEELCTICALLGYDAGFSSVKDKYYLITSTPGKSHSVRASKHGQIKQVESDTIDLGHDAVLCKQNNKISVCCGRAILKNYG